MSQLIKITTTPIKLSLKVERGQFEEIEPKFYADKPRRTTNVTNTQTQQQTYKPVQQRINTDVVNLNPQTIRAHIPVEFATIDNVLNMRIKNNGDDAAPAASMMDANKVVRERITDSQSMNVAVVSNSNEAVKWQPSMLDLDIEMTYDDGTDLRYVPGKVSVEIEEYPSVQIEYLGGPMYVPPSADPNHKGDK